MTRRTTVVAALAAATLVAALGGCGRISLPRFGAATPAGPLFSTKLCGVQVDARARTARLRLTLAVLQTLPAGAQVETEFRNPVDRSVLTVTRAATGTERTIEQVSPPIAEVRARNYETITRVYAAKDRKQVLGTHGYVCESLVDQRELGPDFR